MNQPDLLEQTIARTMELTPQPNAERLERIYLRIVQSAPTAKQKVSSTILPWLLLGATLAAAAVGHWYYRVISQNVTNSQIGDTTTGIQTAESLGIQSPGVEVQSIEAQKTPVEPTDSNVHPRADIIYRQ